MVHKATTLCCEMSGIQHTRKRVKPWARANICKLKQLHMQGYIAMNAVVLSKNIPTSENTHKCITQGSERSTQYININKINADAVR